MELEKLWRIRVFGIVQGVGFRPTVSRHADACHIKGNVSNVGPYVEIWAQGILKDLRCFKDRIEHQPPRRAVILKLVVEEMEGEERLPAFSDFAIIESEKRQGDIFVSPDIAICPECKKELYDPSNRRYLHPFINCTCCGPRLTILDAMPYDRVRTSMADFPMCDYCEYEYTHSETRRFDAQPVCCNDCGPEVYLLDSDVRGPEAIRAARRMIAAGGIVGIKGIGGFHLCCDAANEEAVNLLRRRKKRPVKPFAVMMKDLDTVERECFIASGQEDILDGHQKPILLLPKKKGGRVVNSVAPGNPRLGVMLPYAPVHLLLFDYRDGEELSDCLVMTSANTSGAPICRDDEDARRELSGLCDLVLSHNRLIRLRADDTVMDFFEGEPYMIRRSRGYAPLPVMTAEDLSGEVLAIGGELKNTFCIGKNQLYYPSPYIGDMGDVRTVKALQESVKRMTDLLEASPSVAACDLHPGYVTSDVAKGLGLPLLMVQHHYAHILSCMAENDHKGPVIGVSFDGTGYGTDGTIWGGEFLLADYKGFIRLGSVKPFHHVGGDIASKEGWRIAVSLLGSLYEDDRAREIAQELELCDKKSAGVIMTMARRKINTIISTSAGRIFDAVSAVLGICKVNTYEGEASTFLQFAAERYEENLEENQIGNIREFDFEENQKDKDTKNNPVKITGSKLLDIISDGDDHVPYVRLRTDLIVKHIVEERLAGADPDALAFWFHEKLAEAIVAACCLIKDSILAEHVEDLTKKLQLSGSDNEVKDINTVALSGGVWQNQLLLKLTVRLLREKGMEVLIHHLIPPNDGGICLGQAAYAMHHLDA